MEISRNDNRGNAAADPAAIQPPAIQPPAVQPPHGLTARYGVRNGRVAIVMPWEYFPTALSLAVLLVIAWLGLLVYMYIDTGGKWAVVALLGCFWGLVPIVLLCMFAPRWTIVEVDPQRLRVVRRGWILRSAKNIPAGQIEAICLRGRKIVVLAPAEKCVIGSILPEAEWSWVHLILNRVIFPGTSPRDPEQPT